MYSWVKKYRELGEAGLEDRRVQRTAQQGPRTEEERLRIENAQLKHELYLARMERDLQKKLEEIERRDYNHQRLQRNLGILTPMQKHELYKAA